MTGGRAPKRKGDEWERRVRDYWIERGFHAQRTYGAGRPDDVGDLDIAAWIPLVVDCKAVERSDRPGWLDSLWAKIRREGWEDECIPVVIERRRGKNVADAYVTLDLKSFVDLIEEIQSRAIHLATGREA